MKINSIKFGGTSMGSASSIMTCAQIVKEKLQKQKVVVTVSAVSGVTDTLFEIISLAKKQKPRLIIIKVSELEKKHKQILYGIIDNDELAEDIWMQDFDALLKKLKAISSGISLVGDLTEKTTARICAFGEKLSSYLMKHALSKLGIESERVESEKVVRTDSNFLSAGVLFSSTYSACRNTLNPLITQNITPIVTGFIGKDTHGNTTLLGRGGSDYTASILAMALKAEAIEIWTDVNGIMSGDPRIVQNAISWNELDVDLMSEMAYSGAKVVHPATITLAIQKNIPVYVFNTFDRKFAGTKVTNKPSKRERGVVASADNILIILEHPSIIDHVGFISKVTTIVAKHDISIDVCTTSEISFTFSIKEQKYSKKLHKELQDVAKVILIKKVTKVCVIGHKITQNYKLMSDIFLISAENNIPIHAISTSAAYNNITLIINNADKNKMVKLLHNKLLES